jgi:hypothetical protein
MATITTPLQDLSGTLVSLAYRIGLKLREASELSDDIESLQKGLTQLNTEKNTSIAQDGTPSEMSAEDLQTAYDVTRDDLHFTILRRNEVYLDVVREYKEALDAIAKFTASTLSPLTRAMNNYPGKK